MREHCLPDFVIARHCTDAISEAGDAGFPERPRAAGEEPPARVAPGGEDVSGFASPRVVGLRSETLVTRRYPSFPSIAMR
jgi:hypothetical protein